VFIQHLLASKDVSRALSHSRSLAGKFSALTLVSCQGLTISRKCSFFEEEKTIQYLQKKF
jgi:hypothetical protein